MDCYIDKLMLIISLPLPQERFSTYQVSSESLYFWLNSLTCFEEGEANLMKTSDCVLKLQELLTKSHNMYQEGLTNLKVSTIFLVHRNVVVGLFALLM